MCVLIFYIAVGYILCVCASVKDNTDCLEIVQVGVVSEALRKDYRS